MNAEPKRPKKEALTLEILNEISERSDLSQRHLARKLGVALGIANLYVKRCVKKGYVKIAQAPANRYFYYLTPSGFSEKSRLTGEFLSSSFDFYRQASKDLIDTFDDCKKAGVKRVVLGGTSMLTEIGITRLHDTSLELRGIYCQASEVEKFAGYPVLPKLDGIGIAEAGVFLAVTHAPSLYRDLINEYGEEKVFVPQLVRALTGAVEPR